MKDKTIIIIVRLVCGTVILITSQITKIDGTLLGISLFLMGVPLEYVKGEKETKEG